MTRRTIQIATLSIARTRGDEPLYGTETDAGGEVYWLSRGSLLSGHSIRCEVTGVLMPEEDEAENTLSNIRIYDRTGRDVTEYYRIETLYGTLRWLPDEEEPKQPVSRRLPNE